MTDDPKPKSRRGFAGMTPEKRRQIASKGGASVPADQRPYAKNPELARIAGKKGGDASIAARRARQEQADE